MEIITTAQEMSAFSRSKKASGASVGFVPTMGALHQGHLSLVRQSQSTCTVTVVSIFVNPTQFNDPNDLEKYPRTFESDSSLLQEIGVDALFFPSVEQVYPTTLNTEYELDGLDSLMEGPDRPGHFNGVVQVVMRLFDVVDPDVAFFGEKDYQQLAILRHMTAKLGYDIDIIGCPTLRENSGLAMSSRNVRLTETGRLKAAHLKKALDLVQHQLSKGTPVGKAIQAATEYIFSQREIDLKYLELVDSYTLRRATDETKSVRACIAACIDGVRLIDNMQVK